MENKTQVMVERADAQLESVRDNWLGRTGVTGIDVGFLWKGAVMSDQVGIRVKVQKLLEPADVPEGELFPRYLGGVRVQVREEPAPGLHGLQ